MPCWDTDCIYPSDNRFDTCDLIAVHSLSLRDHFVHACMKDDVVVLTSWTATDFFLVVTTKCHHDCDNVPLGWLILIQLRITNLRPRRM